VRFAARAGAVLFLGLTIGHAAMRGGHLEYEGSPWLKLAGKVAGVVGFAAEDIRIQGLVHQEPERLLSAIGVTPGGSLIGFNAASARRELEKLDWVQSANVQWLFPNQLEIAVVERVPFAIWQRGSEYHVIDSSGVAMSGVPASAFLGLPLVTGEGAETAAAELINELSANPALLLQVKAAARVGDRRWTLYLDSGVTILLPEANWVEALAILRKLDETQGLLSKGIRSVDFRVAGRISVAVAEVTAEAGAK
jgi:cell division protein FtsQ